MDGTEILAVAVYVPLIVAAAVAVWRRPVLALYLFVFGLAVHNIVMASLYEAGVRGLTLDAIAAWKEILLAGRAPRGDASGRAACRFDRSSWTRSPSRSRRWSSSTRLCRSRCSTVRRAPRASSRVSGTRSCRCWRTRSGARSVSAARELRRLGYAVVGVAALLRGRRDRGAVHGVRSTGGASRACRAGIGTSSASTTTGRRACPRTSCSTWARASTRAGSCRRSLSPLASGYLLAVALLFVATFPTLATIAAAPLLLAALLLTHSRSTLIALAGGLVVLALVRRRWWPAIAAPILVGVAVAFVANFAAVVPEGRFTAEDLGLVSGGAAPLEEAGEALSLGEPSLSSHLRALRDGFERVGAHPQGYGLGNAGSVAVRTDTPLLAGESTYAELAIEIGVVGLALFIAWNGALLVALARQGRQVAVAAWLAAALATVLALAVQTDVLGVPWLAFCLWAFAGSAVQLAGAERAVLGGDVIRPPAEPVPGLVSPAAAAPRDRRPSSPP